MSGQIDFSGMRITIMGLGLLGGGTASARFFAEHGADVTVTDLKTEDDLRPSIQSLTDIPIRYVLGKHDKEDFIHADIVIKNPGAQFKNNIFLAAAKRVETDVSIFLRYSESPVIAVTGSKGKSSIVSVLYHVFKELGYPVFLGGNITSSPLLFLHKTNAATPVVLELSSAQLGDLRDCGAVPFFHPNIALITDIMPDHLNRYASMTEYVADKKVIYAGQKGADTTICNYDDKFGKEFASETKAQVLWYSEHCLPEDLCGGWLNKNGIGHIRREPHAAPIEIMPQELLVHGYVQRKNILMAALALVRYGIEPAHIVKAVQTYHGIEHRMELFYEKDGVQFYNDTTATIPQAVIAALNSFTTPVILIIGGMDKNVDIAPLALRLRAVKRVVLLAGSATDMLIPYLRGENIPFDGAFTTMQDAVQAACRHARPGDSVLLSPAAASFNLFKNEFDRGQQFKHAVRELF